MTAGTTAAEFRAEPAESRFLQSGVQGGSTHIKGGIVMVTIIRKLAFVKLTFLLSITLCAVSAFAAGPHQVITGEELQALMKDGQPVKIVDVREPELFKEGHVPGAINIPYDTAHGRILKELSPKDRVVFICHGGPMGDELGGILTKNGYTKVYNVKGGMKRWKGPLEK